MDLFTEQQRKAWDNALGLLRNEVSTAIMNAYFNQLRLHAVVGSTIVFEVPNRLILDSIQSRRMAILQTVINITFENSIDDIVLALSSDLEQMMRSLSKSMLRGDYTFDNFVVGPSNNFAYAACVAVAEEPGTAYNPLFIYGGVGLGKTHLMNAIGNYISLTSPEKNVQFITSESFTNEFITSLRKKKGTDDLRERNRSADVFMVDDIQFLSKTTVTQEEFFHTFNDLYENGSQIILSSDRPPNDIPTIEERLRSRFSMGLTVDIRKPDFETRVAILGKKCDDEGIDCPNEVLEYIARRVESNIRELEGALNRLKAKSELVGGHITLEFATETLEDVLPSRQAAIVTPRKIIEKVAERYDVTAEDIISKKRNREFALPRQVAMHLLREMTTLSTTSIGNELGGRDHTTVMHGCDKIATQLRDDPTFKHNIEELKENIKGA